MKSKIQPPRDPSQRYEKTEDILFARERKVFFSGYDTVSGNTVIWMELYLGGLSRETVSRIQANVEWIEEISHPNILHLLAHWSSGNIMYLITDSLTSKSFGELVYSSYFTMNMRVMTRWFAEIVGALCYLQKLSKFHGHLSLANVQVKTNTGHLKINLPFTSLEERPYFKVNYFTPPERLFGICDVQSDVWTLGIIILETITKTKPYAECETPSDLINKLINNEPPKLLATFEDGNLKDFLNQCFLPHALRPLPSDLIEHPFLKSPKRRESAIIESPSKNSPNIKLQSQLTLQDNGPINTEQEFQICDFDQASISSSLPGIQIPSIQT